jgi:hypothetical protein
MEKKMRTLQELKKKELIELIVSVRPFADAYKRILQGFGIDNDLLGFITDDKVKMLEWIATQGYKVDRQVDGETYWMKYHKSSQMPCGTTKDLVQKYETYRRTHQTTIPQAEI